MALQTTQLYRDDCVRDHCAAVVFQYFDGLITEAEMTVSLDTMSIRGACDNERFCGYDYRAQRWLEIVLV
jgi:hypothetical protein